MNSNKQIIVWTDRPPFFTKTPFVFLSNSIFRVTFLYRRDDKQADRKSVHGIENYGNCELLNCNEIISSRKTLLDFLNENKNAVHIVNGFYISPFLKYKDFKKVFPESKVFLLSEKPQTFRKPMCLFKPLLGLSSVFKAFKNKKYIDGIFALGEDACSYFAKHGWKKSRIHNFIYSFDFNLVKNNCIQKKTNSDAFKFLYIGRFDFKIKGVNYLLKAIDKLGDSNKQCSFEFVGGYGDNTEDVQNFINHHDNCSFAGQLSFYDVFKKISQCDCVIVPSIRDGWNINVLQALCCGKPVIATTGSGSERIVSRFCYGSVCKKRNVNSLKKAIKNILHDKESYLKYKNNAIKYSKYFSNKLLGEYIADVIDGKKGNLY